VAPKEQFMAATPGVQGTSGQQSSDANAPLRNLDLDQFIKLMVTELQNQDPLNPMDNSQILSQISQIREIEATDKMSKSLDSLLTSQSAVLLGQGLANAGTLIGKKVSGLMETKVDDGDPDTKDEVTTETVTGVVDRVSIEDGNAVLHVGDKYFPLNKLIDVRTA
jgi:flagellar basal-body rod modification protein FlgD